MGTTHKLRQRRGAQDLLYLKYIIVEYLLVSQSSYNRVFIEQFPEVLYVKKDCILMCFYFSPYLTRIIVSVKFHE